MDGNVQIRGIKDLKNLSLDVLHYRDQISKILSDVELKFYNIKNYYQSDDGELLNEKMSEVSGKFQTLLQMTKNYSDTLDKVREVYASAGINATDTFANKPVKPVISVIKTPTQDQK